MATDSCHVESFEFVCCIFINLDFRKRMNEVIQNVTAVAGVQWIRSNALSQRGFSYMYFEIGQILFPQISRKKVIGKNIIKMRNIH